MFEKIKARVKSTSFVENYGKMLPYIRPYWIRGLLAVLITIPIGGMDAVIAWSLKPYMDVVMVEKSASSTWYIPLVIILFSCLQSTLSYTATYLNTWVGRKIANDVKVDLFDKLMHYDAAFFDKNRKNWLHILTDDAGENYNRSKVFPTVAAEMNGEIDNWTKKFKENRRGINEEYYNR